MTFIATHLEQKQNDCIKILKVCKCEVVTIVATELNRKYLHKRLYFLNPFLDSKFTDTHNPPPSHSQHILSSPTQTPHWHTHIQKCRAKMRRKDKTKWRFDRRLTVLFWVSLVHIYVAFFKLFFYDRCLYQYQCFCQISLKKYVHVCIIKERNHQFVITVLILQS